jgi:hypothetical protein
MVMRRRADSSDKHVARTAQRWLRPLVLISVTAFLASCAGPLAELPDIAKLPDKMMNKDQQQAKISEMLAKGQSHQSEAAKEIENQK